MAKSHTTVSSTSHAAQSVMARILATENIRVVVDPTMNTAAFDLKNRTLMLPQWKDMGKSVYDMLIGHEISHALHTPADGWRETCNKISGTTDHNAPAWRTASLYLNVVEDARIERMIQIKFPGFRRDFIAAYNELNAKDFFGVKYTNMNTLTLADRINLYYKLGTIGAVGISFTAAEDQFIRRIDNATTFAEASQIAEDLFRFCNEQQHKNQQQQNNGSPNKPCNGGQSDKGQNKSQGDKPSQKQEQQDQGESGDTPDRGGDQGGDESQSGGGDTDQQDDKGPQPADSKDGNSAPKSDMGGGADSTPGAVPPVPMTQQTFNEKMSQQVQRDNYGSIQAPTKLVHCNLDKVVIDCKKCVETARTDAPFLWNPTTFKDTVMVEFFTKTQADFMRASKKQVDLLMKQFELRKAAQIAKRESVRKTGILDTVRMVNYKHSEDIFRRNTMLPEGKNHGLVMFVDWSGSMGVCLEAVMEQTMVLVEFCRRMQIPYEVFAFTTRSFDSGKDRSDGYYDDADTKKSNDQWSGDVERHYSDASKEKMIASGFHNPSTHPQFALLNILSSRLSRTEHTDMMHFLRAFVSRGRDPQGQTHFMMQSMRWELSGTALDESIVAAMQIVPQFKTANKLDIVNTIFLTDGDTSVPYVKGSQLIDPKTKAVYSDEKFNTTGYSDCRSTDVLLLALRDITKANVVGMYLTHDAGHIYAPRFFRKEYERRMKMQMAGKSVKDRYAEMAAQRAVTKEISTELRKQFNEDNCLIADADTTGYSEYYIIKSTARVVQKDDPMDAIAAGASQAAVKKAFLKSFENKNKSRVLINRFIELIAR